MKPGLEWTKVLIHTDSKTKPDYDVTLETRKGVVAEPSAVYFGGVPAGEATTRTFKLHHGSSPFSIVGIDVDGDRYEASWQPEGDDGKSYRVTVTYKGGAPGALIGKLTIRTDLSGSNAIVVPIGGNSR
jgi:hypothetical protein